MFVRRGKTFILRAEHYTVVQKQGSRGFVRGECANGESHQTTIKKETKIHHENEEKSMQNPC